MEPKPMFNEEQFFAFARQYFSTAFPNPNRDGCPAEAALRSQANDPLTADPAVLEHIGLCSLCFGRYMELLAMEKQSLE